MSKMVRFFLTSFRSHIQSTEALLKGSVNLVSNMSSQVESILGRWVGYLVGAMLSEGRKLGELLGLKETLGARVGRSVGKRVGEADGLGVRACIGRSEIGAAGASVGDLDGEEVEIVWIETKFKTWPDVAESLFSTRD
jgi:hypothetical protein